MGGCGFVLISASTQLFYYERVGMEATMTKEDFLNIIESKGRDPINELLATYYAEGADWTTEDVYNAVLNGEIGYVNISDDAAAEELFGFFGDDSEEEFIARLS